MFRLKISTFTVFWITMALLSCQYGLGRGITIGSAPITSGRTLISPSILTSGGTSQTQQSVGPTQTGQIGQTNLFQQGGNQLSLFGSISPIATQQQSLFSVSPVGSVTNQFSGQNINTLVSQSQPGGIIGTQNSQGTQQGRFSVFPNSQSAQLQGIGSSQSVQTSLSFPQGGFGQRIQGQNNLPSRFGGTQLQNVFAGGLSGFGGSSLFGSGQIGQRGSSGGLSGFGGNPQGQGGNQVSASQGLRGSPSSGFAGTSLIGGSKSFSPSPSGISGPLGTSSVSSSGGFSAAPSGVSGPSGTSSNVGSGGSKASPSGVLGPSGTSSVSGSGGQGFVATSNIN